MKHTPSFLMVIACALFISIAAFGQTAPPEPKHVQLPDMNGYDWSSETIVPSAVADDWLCENGLPINQITWWGSYYIPSTFPYKNSDNFLDPSIPGNVPPGTVTGFNIAIFSNKEEGECYPWSMPGDLLYLTSVSIADANETLYGVATKPGGQVENVWQYTVVLKDLFAQKEGETYWLAIQAIDGELGSSTFTPFIQWGWHQTDKLIYGFGEDAVQIGFTPNECEEWDLLVDTEMAFKLYSIPEPSLMGLLFGSMTVLGMLIRKRS